MLGASVADLHLGFRTFPSLTDGRNTREVDVELAWEETVRQIIASGAKVVTIAGDIFHHPRVTDYAKLAFLDGINMLLSAHIKVVVLQGNHDSARTSDVLTPLLLAGALGRQENLYIVTTPEQIKFTLWNVVDRNSDEYEIVGDGEKVSISCFPFVARGDGVPYKLVPDPDADVNILVMHAAVRGSADGDHLPYFYGAGDQALDVGKESDRWDVIACGDYHEFTRLHPTALAFYSGSIERTSSNIWKEHNPKGWVLWDTDAKTMEFKEIPTRQMVDLVAEGEPTAEGVNRLLTHVSEITELVNAIVRFKVDDFPLEEREHIDWALVRTLKASMTHFYLAISYRRSEEQALGDRRERGLTMAEEAVKFFADDDELVRLLAMSYMDVQAEAEDVEEGEL